MIEQIKDIKFANECDILLTKLIQDERKYDSYIDSDFVVVNFYQNVINNDGHLLYGYFKDNDLLGYIYLKPITTDNKKGYLIDALYVREEYRRQGIGESLLKYGLDLIKDQVDFVDIGVLSQNVAAIKLYEKVGFINFKTLMRNTF